MVFYTAGVSLRSPHVVLDVYEFIPQTFALLSLMGCG